MILNDPWQFEILITATIDYDEGWRMKLSNATKLPPTEINLLNIEYTDYLGGIIHHFIKKNKIKTLDFVASHGHTVFHQPEQGITLQIGNLSDLADRTAFPVVCDFRVQDLELGGAGSSIGSRWRCSAVWATRRLSQFRRFFQLKSARGRNPYCV